MKSKIKFVIVAFIVTVISGCCNTANTCKISKARWQYLFNGKDLAGWVQRGGKARYFVEDGAIVGETVSNTPSGFLCTEKHFSDFILEFEFKVDPELNSGVQIRSDTKLNKKGKVRVFGYQVEIDASNKPFVPKPQKKRPANLMADGRAAPEGLPRRWTGGIYDEARRGWLYPLHNDPVARAAFKQGKWNHIRVEAIGDSIKTWVNGVPAADLRDSETASGFIGLQVHRIKEPLPKPMQVRFRNIRIKDLSGNKS